MLHKPKRCCSHSWGMLPCLPGCCHCCAWGECRAGPTAHPAPGPEGSYARKHQHCSIAPSDHAGLQWLAHCTENCHQQLLGWGSVLARAVLSCWEMLCQLWGCRASSACWGRLVGHCAH